jgi:hypothetical protein
MMLDDTIDARGRGELPDGQFVDVRYADLMREPVDTLQQLYQQLGLDWRASHGDAVTQHLAARPKDAHGPHEYSLPSMDLDVATERRRFRRYQDRFGIPDEI